MRHRLCFDALWSLAEERREREREKLRDLLPWLVWSNERFLKKECWAFCFFFVAFLFLDPLDVLDVRGRIIPLYFSMR